MRHTGRIILFAAPLVVLTIAGILLFVTLAPSLNARWTDDAGISAPRSLPPRSVLWEPARPLLLPGHGTGDEYEPRISPDGTMLAFVRRRAGANADLYLSRLLPDARWSEPQSIASINTPSDELGPEFAPDGQTLYYYSDRSGGLGGYDLWSATRESDSFSSPTNLGPAVNTEFNEYAPAWLPDASRLIFASNRPKPGETRPGSPAWPATLREQHARYDYDLYSADFRDHSFSAAAIVATLATNSDEGSPAVSPAGDFLYFASDRSGGLGGFDLYRARLRHSSPLPPDNLGPAINSPRNELDPALAAHGFLLVFSSDRSHAGSDPSDPSEAIASGAAPIAPATPKSTYSLFQSTSREVYLADDENASARVLARVWHDAWPWLALLAMLAALLWLVARLWKSELFRRRIAQLSLLAKCVLASAVIHTLLALLFAVWQVSQHAGDLFRAPGGSGIIVSSSASPDSLTSQVRAGLAIDVPATASPELPAVSPPDLPLQNATFVPAAPGVISQPDRVPTTSDEPFASHRTTPRETHSIAPAVPPTEAIAASIPVAPAPPVPAAEPLTAWSASVPRSDEPAPVPVARGDALPKSQLPSPLEEPTTPARPEMSFDAAPTPTRATNSSQTTMAPPIPTQSEARESSALRIPIATSAPTASGEPTPTVDASLPNSPGKPIALPLASLSSGVAHAAPTPTPLPVSSPTLAESTSPLDLPSTLRSSDGQRTSPRLELPMTPSDATDAHFAARLPVPIAPGSPATAQSESSLTNAASISLRSLDLAPAAPSLPATSADVRSATARPSPLAVAAPATSQLPQTANPSTRRSGSTSDAPTPSHSYLTSADSDLASAARLPEVPADAPPTLTPSETFAQRTPELRGEVLRQTGGTPESEQAVQRALAWLAKHQESDGHWGTRAFDASCRCGGQGEVEADTAMTGLALLCFLGAGHTHQDPGPYTQTVAKALAWLTSRQTPSGDLRRGETMYGQTVACVALCEAFAMTQDQALASSTRRAFDFILAQSTRTATSRLDTSVLGWYVMAVESARRAGLTVPANALTSTKSFLASAASTTSPGRYSPRKGESPSPDMTAEAMFVQQLLGHARAEPAMDESARFILHTPPRWRDGAPTHYWYYATLALFQHQGNAWTQWNEALVSELLANQRTDANAAGSWDPQDEWSRTCGRIYQTAICTLSLEVYYRYKPAGVAPHQP